MIRNQYVLLRLLLLSSLARSWHTLIVQKKNYQSPVIICHTPSTENDLRNKTGKSISSPPVVNTQTPSDLRSSSPSKQPHERFSPINKRSRKNQSNPALINNILAIKPKHAQPSQREGRSEIAAVDDTHALPTGKVGSCTPGNHSRY